MIETDLLRSLPQAGPLVQVLYAMPSEGPRVLQAVGLTFDAQSVTFRSTRHGLVVERVRLCGAGVCREGEDCYLATGSARWAPLIGRSVVRSSAASDAARLVFEDGTAIELHQEAGALYVTHRGQSEGELA